MRRRTILSIVAVIIPFAVFGFYIPHRGYYRPSFALGQALFNPTDEVALTQLHELADAENATIHKVTRRLEIYMVSWEPSIDREAYETAARTGDIATVKTLQEQGELEVHRMVELIKNSGLVIWAQPNSYRYIAYTPNDPYFPDDGDHTPSSGPDQFDKAMIHCPEAWDIQKGSESIILAILDSGVDVDHPDLTANIWVNPGEDADGDGEVGDWDDVNGLDNDGNGYIDDLYGYDFVGGVTGEEMTPPDQEDWNPDIHYYGDDGWGEPDPSCGNGSGSIFMPADGGVSHGTHCAGIAAAVMDNATMFAGVAGGGCKILPVRIGNPEGSMTISDIVAGIEFATISGAHVISMSLGGMSSEPEPAESTMIDFAWSAGVVLVAASGNMAGIPFIGNDTCAYPASSHQTIAVGSCDISGNRASFSQHGSMLDVVAPGGASETSITETIWSTWVASVADANDDPSLDPGDHIYNHAEGTSMACPQVTGICGLLLSEDPTLGNEEIRDIINSTADDVMDPGFDLETGYGLVNAYNALRSLSICEKRNPNILKLDIRPNPFNASCTITADGDIEIFDISGRLVREFEETMANSVFWDGKDEAGKELPSGIYLIRVSSGERAVNRPVTLLK